MLSVALLSQAKKSDCGMAQPSSCICGNNVLNKRYARTTPRNQGINQSEAQKIGYRMRKNRKKERKNFDLQVQGLLRKCWTKIADKRHFYFEKSIFLKMLDNSSQPKKDNVFPINLKFFSTQNQARLNNMPCHVLTFKIFIINTCYIQPESKTKTSSEIIFKRMN